LAHRITLRSTAKVEGIQLSILTSHSPSLHALLLSGHKRIQRRLLHRFAWTLGLTRTPSLISISPVIAIFIVIVVDIVPAVAPSSSCLAPVRWT
jgi:hypothetical protein